VADRDADFPSGLIPELALWNEGRGIDVDSWIGCVGNYEHAIGYGRLFWPKFREHDGGVFFDYRFKVENYDAFMKQTAGDRRSVEAVMNHHHILDLFGDPELAPTRAQIKYLGRLLREMWAAKLERDFPGRQIVVAFDDADKDDDLDYEVTFFQATR